MSARQMARDASMAEAARIGGDRAERRTRAAGLLLLALAAAAGGAWALIRFATPCTGGTLC